MITLSIHYNGGKIDSDKDTLLLIHHLIFAKNTMEEELVLIQIVYLGNAIQFTALHKEYLGIVCIDLLTTCTHGPNLSMLLKPEYRELDWL